MHVCRRTTSKLHLTLICALVSMLVLVAGCNRTPGGSAEKPYENQTLNLYVAAGMKKPMDVVIQKFQEETGVKVVPNYASSGGLWAQIREGQPCDLYYSADWIYIEMAQDEKMLSEAREFLSDRLVLVVSESGAKKITTMDDLKKPGVTFAIGDPQAPVGVYAETALRNLNLWDQVKGTLKAMPSTVNQVAILVKEEQVDAGLIYRSVANGNDLEIVQVLDQEITGEIIFGVGVIKGGNEKLATLFMEFAFDHVDEFCSYGWEPYE